jgi:hypothetical protein
MCPHQEKPPLENYFQYREISFLLRKEGQFAAIGRNILQVSMVGNISTFTLLTGVGYGSLNPH